MRSVQARMLLAQRKVVLNGWSEPPMQDTYRAIVDACRRHGLTGGIHTATPAFAGRLAELGFRLITLVGDFNFILAGRAPIRQARDLLAAVPAPSAETSI